MRRIATNFCAFVVLAILVIPSLAEASRPGPYVQGAFVMQWLTGDAKTKWDNRFPGSSNDYLGGSLAGGYFIFEWLAFGARLQIIDQRAVESGSTQMAALYAGQVKLYPLQIGGSGGLLEPYLTSGFGAQTTFGTNCSDCSDTNFLFELGAGLDIMFTSQWGLFAEFDYQLVTSVTDADVDSFDVENENQLGFLMGITYRF